MEIFCSLPPIWRDVICRHLHKALFCVQHTTAFHILGLTFLKKFHGTPAIAGGCCRKEEYMEATVNTRHAFREVRVGRDHTQDEMREKKKKN